MKIIETSRFRKSFNKLAKTIKKKTREKTGLFLKNITHPSLNTEKLEPRQSNIWSFRIDRNHRVCFTFLPPDTVLFLDIGPHDIYRKL